MNVWWYEQSKFLTGANIFECSTTQKKWYSSTYPSLVNMEIAQAILFIKDSNVVDWDELVNVINKKNIERRTRETAYEYHAAINEEVGAELISPFLTNGGVTDKSFIIKAKVSEYRRIATIRDIHSQDLLYYGIVDLVKNGKCATVSSVLKDEFAPLKKYMDAFLDIKYVKPKMIQNYTKQLLKDLNDLKKMLKEEESRLRLDGEERSKVVDRKDKKTVIKIIKLFVKATENRSVVNWLKKNMTEAEFTGRFVTPLMDPTLKSCSTKMVFQFGEQKLLLVKDYENSALTEDDTRLPGPNIDGIISNSKVDIPIALLEVSGSPNSHAENYTHYKGDRNKLAKNLKYLFKVIISMKGTPSFQTVCKLKLFAIHIYYDQVYIYSLSMPMWDVFVLKPEYKFFIPVLRLKYEYVPHWH